jgi:hypothetical protein
MADNHGLTIKGDLLFKRKVANVLQPSVDLGAVEFSMKMNSKDLEILGKGRTNYLQPTDFTSIAQAPELTIAFGGISPRSLAIAVQGTQTAFSQASGTATDEVVTANKDGYADLAFRNIAATGIVVKNSAGSTTYVKDTDYTIDYSSGQLFVLLTSAITDAQSLKISYSYNAVAAQKVLGLTEGALRGEFYLKGINVFNNQEIEVKVWDAAVSTDGVIDWLSDKPVEVKLKGKMITPNGRASSFEILTAITNS